jgi:hypothetical protein
MLDDLQNKINSLRQFDWGYEMEKVIHDNSEVIADLQAEQWAKGETAKGEEILPPYAPYTIEQKRQKTGLAAVTDHVTFYDTGELYKSLQAPVANMQYDITSNNFKFKKATDRSGLRIVGLTDSNRLRFAEEITLPGVRKVFKEKTGFSF